MLRGLLDGVLAAVFPTDCALCGRELISGAHSRVCPRCWGNLVPWEGARCCRCGLPFVSAHALDSTDPQCGACRDEEPAFDKARSFGLYTGDLRRVILHLKFGHREDLGKHLGALLAPCWTAIEELQTGGRILIVPVPLHASRRRERGFNQAELLATGLLRALRRNGRHDLRLAKDCLVRTRSTPPQTGLSVSARHENPQGAFHAGAPDKLKECTAVLIDDVMTTGSTLSACARALKRDGAVQVMGITLARATPQFPDFASSGNS